MQAKVQTDRDHQQKELIILQAKLQTDQEQLRLDSEYAIEKMKQQTEQAKLQVEQNRLDLIGDGKISAAAQVSSGPTEHSAGGV